MATEIYTDEHEEMIICKVKKRIGIKCDICGKVIPAIGTDSTLTKDSSKYYDVITGHNDWHNDSIESVEEHCICSDCIGKFVTNYLLDKEVSDTAYINIDTKYLDVEEIKSDIVEDCKVWAKLMKE